MSNEENLATAQVTEVESPTTHEEEAPKGPLNLDEVENPRPATDTPVEAAEEAPDAAEESSEEADEGPKPKKSRFQERIDRLTAEKYTAERERERLQREVDRLSKGDDAPVDPDDWEALEKRRVRDALRDERRLETEARLQEVSQESMQQQVELFHEKVEAASARIPDLKEALGVFQDLPVTTDSATIIAESDHAAEIAYYMGKNPKVAFDIAKMSPVQQGRAIAQIEHRVKAPVKKVSKAPAPAKTIAPQSAAPVSKDPGKMSALEYANWRQSQWAKGGR